MDALIRYFLHKECVTIDEYADYWNKLLYLEKLGLLPVAQIPLKFVRR